MSESDFELGIEGNDPDPELESLLNDLAAANHEYDLTCRLADEARTDCSRIAEEYGLARKLADEAEGRMNHVKVVRDGLANAIELLLSNRQLLLEEAEAQEEAKVVLAELESVGFRVASLVNVPGIVGEVTFIGVRKHMNGFFDARFENSRGSAFVRRVDSLIEQFKKGQAKE